MQRETFFWPWDERTGVVRWMCAFDTEAEDVDRFVATLSSVLARR
jgi:threonine aldolase